MGSRKGFSTLLIVGALVLVGAILVGNSMGSRVLDAVAGRSLADLATPIPTPVASAEDVRFRQNLRRRQVLSVATDPGFPDPRITPEPTLAPTAEPTYAPRRRRHRDDLGVPPVTVPEETAEPLVYPSEEGVETPAPIVTAPPEETSPAATVQPVAPASATPAGRPRL